MLLGNMEVTSRSFQAAMPQQDLDGAQIGARLEQMSCKAVPSSRGKYAEPPWHNLVVRRRRYSSRTSVGSDRTKETNSTGSVSSICVPVEIRDLL
jgi:hypothetical protein